MGKRTSYTPGTFSWVDLATTDGPAAKAFYAGLFGWEMEDNDAGGGAVYTTCRLDGDAVAGLYEMTEEMRATGAPANWLSYVTVADADGAVARVRELGGGAIDDAFGVLDVGRMAVLNDPQGAVFAVWEPRSRIGAERVNGVGCLCNNELATSDLDAACSFYADAFGWTTERIDTGPGGPEIVAAYNDGTLNANFSAARPGEPPHWRVYFGVESTKAAIERVRGLGGTALLEPVPVPAGSFAIARDPHGAVFALFAGEFDP
jgi:predicted enzyme related to lactoylglutathione lyase